MECIIDLIIRKELKASIVYEDEHCIAFLDKKPLFLGHTLVAPKGHHPTLFQLPEDLIAPLFTLTQTIGKAVQSAMKAEGIFIAMNNVISQSIPHLHIHIVPRNKQDGLRGFFWPRQQYESDDHMSSIRDTIKLALTG